MVIYGIISLKKKRTEKTLEVKKMQACLKQGMQVVFVENGRRIQGEIIDVIASGRYRVCTEKEETKCVSENIICEIRRETVPAPKKFLFGELVL